MDYGCGTGVFLQLLGEGGFPGALCGCDVSTGMLAQARSTWPDGGALDLRVIRDGRAPFEDRSFDVILGSGVFHHIPPDERPGAFADIARMLRPGGRAYIFEHNPLNPVTQWVVRRTPVDRDAVLLPARETARGLAAVGLRDLRKAYLMFFPPRWRWARAGESWLRWLPLGGQYVAVANRPLSG